MFAAIYHWKLKGGVQEKDWIEKWSKGTTYIHQTYGSFGAALHKDADGTFWSYARWPNKEMWQKMMDDKDKPYPNKPFVDLIGEPIQLEVVDDQLI
jgi:hypothetical protein